MASSWAESVGWVVQRGAEATLSTAKATKDAMSGQKVSMLSASSYDIAAEEERIALLLDQLDSSALVSEQRLASQKLLELSGRHRRILGTSGIPCLVKSLSSAPRDVELTQNVLELLQLLVAEQPGEPYLANADVFLQTPASMDTLLELTAETNVRE